MLKKVLYSVIISLLACGCFTNSEKVVLDQNTQYDMPADFQLVRITQVEVDSYKSLFANANDNALVLYKVIKGRNTRIYIGICYETNLKQIKSKILDVANNQIISQDSSKVNSFTVYQKHDTSTFVLHHYKELNSSGNKYIFTVTSSNKDILAPDFFDKYIKSRIISE